MLHGRFSGLGEGMPNWVVVDIVRVENDVLTEHWDVVQDEARPNRDIDLAQVRYKMIGAKL
jgi:predicted SnoaL-like aldol condensation-catalyzing enzyme